MSTGGSLTIRNSLFFNNVATGLGSVIAVLNIPNVLIEDSLFFSNGYYVFFFFFFFDRGNPAIFVDASNVTITRSTFRNNFSTVTSGAIQVNRASSFLSIEDSLFEGNEGDFGSAISSSSAVGIIKNTNFTLNRASTVGKFTFLFFL